MPIYEYEREDGSHFELIQKITDEPLSVCPTTGQKVKRLVSQSAFHLKGGGWYKTDYSSGGNSRPSSTSTSSESDTKSESSSSESTASAPASSDKSNTSSSSD